MRLQRAPRPATTLVECAFVYPATLLLLLGLLIGGLGIFRYQEMASLARDAARWASVHGGQYAKETGNSAATPADVYTNAIAPRAVILDPNQLSYTVTWNTDNYPYHTVTSASGDVRAVTNTVTVTLSYKWLPEAFLGGITLSSTSVAPMAY